MIAPTLSSSFSGRPSSSARCIASLDTSSKSLDDSRGSANTTATTATADELELGEHNGGGYGDFLKLLEQSDAAGTPLPRAKETHFHTCLIKDSLSVQKHHRVNDDEVHEENPHLEDYLVPHHSGHIEPPEEAEVHKDSPQPTKCCSKGILVKKSKISSEPQETRQQPRKPKVHFGSVLVRDYDIILGDHPCCSYGPPITIDWDYLEYEALEVDVYEFHHPPRRNLREMGLNYYQRKHLLSQAGYTEVDFKKTKKEVKRSKLNRVITKQVVAYPPLLKVEDAVESARRKFKRLLRDDHWKRQKSLYVK